jgi:hypothetical protein
MLQQIEDLLVAAIPERVRTLGIKEPVYCLRIWYHGTDTEGDRVPSLLLVKESVRRKLIAEKGKPGLDYIWVADELTYPDWMYSAEIEDPRIARLCWKWCSRRLPEDIEEEEELGPMRATVQRVAARLNQLDWGQYTQATDDFVIFPADSSHTFCDDYGDMIASVPAPGIELLRSRDLLGEGFDRGDEEE